jgi:2-dehydropantoate 2-reductase
VAEVWRSGGFRVKCFDDIDQLVWEKLICNVCFSGTCAVTERTIVEVIGDPDTWLVASGCATEAYNVARARGIKLDFTDPVTYVHAFGMKIPNARPSMLLDHMAGRMSEIEAINGAIPVAAKAVRVAAPYNEVISALVQAKERRMGVRK